MPIKHTRYPGIRKYEGTRVTRYLVDYRDGQGSKRRLACSSLQEALSLKARKRRDPGGDPKRTFGDWASNWLDTKRPPVVRKGSYMHFETTLRIHILPVFGKSRISRIEIYEVEKFLVLKLSKGLSRKTVNNIQIVLSGIFRYAIRRDAGFAKNPALGLSKELNLTAKKRGVKALTRDELRALLSAARENYPQTYPALFAMARTGLRIGEAVALRWEDIDFDKREIHIERRHENREPEELKTERSRRTVDMSLQLREMLAQVKHQQLKDKLRGAWSELPVHCFVMRIGTPVRAKYISDLFPKILKLSGLPLYKDQIRLSPHCLRHTFACLHLLAGESPSYVQDQLGHYSISMTKDSYGHWFPASNKEAADRLDDGFDEMQGKLALGEEKA